MNIITSYKVALVIIFIDLLPMETSNSIIIVGGGLAGLTAAIHLSKIGYSVTLVDKNSYPKHKVCGEYVSNEVLPYLNWLGVNPSVLNASKIDRLHFSTDNGTSVQTKLPMGGFGVSRYNLDFFLYQKALENRCSIIHETVTSINFDQDIFSVLLANNQIIKSHFVLGAFGKRSNLDLKLEREFIQKKSPWLAVKAHYKVDYPDDLVGLHHFRGGYCGVSKVENNIVNICYLADYATFSNHKNIEMYEANVVAKNPFLKEILEKATPIFEKPLTISQISFEKKNPVEQHILMIGDSAGLIHPLCGNGMAMAIHSAKITCELIDDYFKKTIETRSELEEKYKQAWNLHFIKRITAGRWLEKLLQQPKLSELLLRLVISFPFLLSTIIKSTHGKTIKVSAS
jgi:flavin-dependent dehydrogenase